MIYLVTSVYPAIPAFLQQLPETSLRL